MMIERPWQVFNRYAWRHLPKNVRRPVGTYTSLVAAASRAGYEARGTAATFYIVEDEHVRAVVYPDGTVRRYGDTP